jgi:hypothetical protein
VLDQPRAELATSAAEGQRQVVNSRGTEEIPR